MSDVPGLVSAVIPAYNYARFLPRAIDSVLAQTYSPIECIVVDDGSTDDTPEVLARYEGKIRAIRQANAGLSAARNTGIAAARGEFVALLDADDWWHERKIEKQVAAIRAEPHVAAVGCGQAWVDTDMTPYRTRIFPQPGRDRTANLRAVALRKLWVGGSGSGLLAKRSALESVGPFDTSLRAAEDWDMWLRLFARYEVRNVQEVLVSIFAHRTGTFRNAALMEDNQTRVADKAIRQWPDVFGPVMQRRLRAHVLADAALELMGAQDLVGARKKMVASLRRWPFDRKRVRVLASLTAKTLTSRLVR